jgi:UDP-2,4-diacetamido-2,4,6-trideoxy-beta-L-altropyranose hydrolase
VARLSLRAASRKDADILLEWRNEPETRANSLTTAEISAEDHVRWLEKKLADRDSRLWIAELDGDMAVGQSRVDRTRPGIGVISVGLARDARGRGLGRRLIEATAQRASVELELQEIRAVVRPENAASRAAFARAGFEDAEHDTLSGSSILILRWRTNSPPKRTI